MRAIFYLTYLTNKVIYFHENILLHVLLLLRKTLKTRCPTVNLLTVGFFLICG
jgi:hypothetical protein